ncbi:MAG: recombinase family protein [Oscillospiraceae bacterium]|jgi:DNA invertase Pin-like site-specific DNA recombinase|nr:recombinase family protein [Oscillospiraceae bacterium]
MEHQKIFGYARVSSREQNSARQFEALRNAGVIPGQVYSDQASGKDFERTEYQALKARLCAGDILVVKSIDRLGRNYHEIIEEWKALTKDLGVHIRVLDLPLLDTTKSGKDLTGTFIADIVLQILSYVAEQERVNIRQRQAEGIALARAQGKHLGRPYIPKPPNFDKVYEHWRAGHIPAAKALKQTGLKRSTFDRFVREKKAEAAARTTSIVPAAAPPAAPTCQNSL